MINALCFRAVRQHDLRDLVFAQTLTNCDVGGRSFPSLTQLFPVNKVVARWGRDEEKVKAILGIDLAGLCP